MTPIDFEQFFKTDEKEKNISFKHFFDIDEQYDKDNSFYEKAVPTICGTGALIGSIISNLLLGHPVSEIFGLSLFSFITMGLFTRILVHCKPSFFDSFFPAIKQRNRHYKQIMFQVENVLANRDNQYAILFQLRQYIDSIKGKIAKHHIENFNTTYHELSSQFEQNQIYDALINLIFFYNCYQECATFFDNQKQKNSFYQGLDDYFEKQNDMLNHTVNDSLTQSILNKNRQAMRQTSGDNDKGVEKDYDKSLDMELQKEFSKMI